MDNRRFPWLSTSDRTVLGCTPNCGSFLAEKSVDSDKAVAKTECGAVVSIVKLKVRW